MSVVSPENDMVNIWPKLFEDIKNPVNPNLRHPLLLGFGPGLFL
jgi:hypothetical protein